MFTNDIFVGSVYFAGVLSFFSPCIFPLLPVYFNILSSGEKRSLLKTILFIAGLTISFILLGFGVGTLGYILKSDYFRVISSIFIIILGIIQMEIIKIPMFQKTKLLSINTLNKDKLFYSFAFGFTFSLGWTPCIGPVLASILLSASIDSNPTHSATLLLVYVFGFSTPFLILSFLYEYLDKKLNFIKRNLNLLKKMSGAILIFMGLLLLSNNFNFFCNTLNS